MKKILFLLISLTLILNIQAQNEEVTEESSGLDFKLDFEKKDGIIELSEANAKIEVPKGFKFIGKEDANYILTKLWGNPEDNTILGLLVPDSFFIFGSNSWAYTIAYDGMGYVKDDDAKDINYDDLLKEMQKETIEGNKERAKLGYEPIYFIGWAEKPYYDNNKKVLHWARELKFGTDSINTLNYNLRVLGRKGIILLNAIATVEELPVINQSVEEVINSVKFNEGQTYADFDSKIDDVAAWTIGGLVAGKVLAKVGILAVLAKFGKFIFIGIVALLAGIKKFFFGKKKEEDTNTYSQE